MNVLFLFVIIMLLGSVVYFLWESAPIISKSVHYFLDPTFGYLIHLNLTVGFIIIIFIITFLTTLIQKYTTDQEALKKLREDQKAMQEEMKQYRNDPAKMLEFQKKQLQDMPKSMELSMKPIIYTALPFILFIRWFTDTFKNLGNPKFFGFMSWFIFYMILTFIFTLILRKIMKVY